VFSIFWPLEQLLRKGKYDEDGPVSFGDIYSKIDKKVLRYDQDDLTGTNREVEVLLALINLIT
jgi:hypothetical protein